MILGCRQVVVNCAFKDESKKRYISYNTLI